jgi:hypothetical protein
VKIAGLGWMEEKANKGNTEPYHNQHIFCMGSKQNKGL